MGIPFKVFRNLHPLFGYCTGQVGHAEFVPIDNWFKADDPAINPLKNIKQSADLYRHYSNDNATDLYLPALYAGAAACHPAMGGCIKFTALDAQYEFGLPKMIYGMSVHVVEHPILGSEIAQLALSSEGCAFINWACSKGLVIGDVPRYRSPRPVQQPNARFDLHEALKSARALTILYRKNVRVIMNETSGEYASLSPVVAYLYGRPDGWRDVVTVAFEGGAE